MTTELSAPSELMRLLEIEFEERGPTRVAGSIPADERHHQGRTQQPWQVEIRRPQDQKLVARGQVRLQNTAAGA